VLAQISQYDRVKHFSKRICFDPRIGPVLQVVESGGRTVDSVGMLAADRDAVEFGIRGVVSVVGEGVVEGWEVEKVEG
jgi:hypothetical protein